MNADEAGLGSSRNLNSFYAYKNTFGDDSVWLDIPKHSVWRKSSFTRSGLLTLLQSRL